MTREPNHQGLQAEAAARVGVPTMPDTIFAVMVRRRDGSAKRLFRTRSDALAQAWVDGFNSRNMSGGRGRAVAYIVGHQTVTKSRAA